jgi:mono/diheme cytochrome c family protein
MTFRRAPVAIAGLVLLAVAAAGGVWLYTSHRTESAQVAAGRQVYAVHCASCHGADLQGQPDWQMRLPNGRMPAPPHDATGHTWHHSDDQLFAIVKKGMSAIVPGYDSDMPGFENVLSDDEIRAVLAFIKSTWAEREREYQARRSAPAKTPPSQ